MEGILQHRIRTDNKRLWLQDIRSMAGDSTVIDLGIDMIFYDLFVTEHPRNLSRLIQASFFKLLLNPCG